jgi:hypothetical protein
LLAILIRGWDLRREIDIGVERPKRSRKGGAKFNHRYKSEE